jgi:hypothetical protein
VRFHHTLGALRTAVEDVQKLTALVSLANGVSHTMGFGVVKDPKAVETCISPAQILGFTAEGLKGLVDEAVAVVQKEKELFD